MKTGFSASLLRHTICFLALVLYTGRACVSWSMVFYHHSNTLQPYVPACHSCDTSQWTSRASYQVPLVHTQTCHTVTVLKLVISITFSMCYDWPTVASVDPSSSAACIAAFRSWGFYCSYPGLCSGFETIQKSKHCLLQVNISILNIFFIKSIYITSHCILLNPVTKSLACFKWIICRFEVSEKLAS